RVMQLAKPVENVVILADQPLDCPQVVVNAVLEDDSDDSSLLIGEEVVEAVHLAIELARDKCRHVGERAGSIRLQEPRLHVLVLARGRRLPEDRMKIESAVVDDDERLLGLIERSPLRDAEPADRQVPGTPSQNFAVEHLEVERILASRELARWIDQAD